MLTQRSYRWFSVKFKSEPPEVNILQELALLETFGVFFETAPCSSRCLGPTWTKQVSFGKAPIWSQLKRQHVRSIMSEMQ